ncbi:NAD kinase [Bacillus cereus]
MADRRNLFFFYGDDKAKLVEKMKPIYRILEENGFTILDRQKMQTLSSVLEMMQLSYKPFVKAGFREDCLYAGISTKDEISFYCDFHIDRVDTALQEITKNEIEVRKYPTIEVDVDGSTSFHCLNEFSLRSSIIKTFVVDVHVDDLYFETFRGDGLVVSTPTGSTAYNKSLRGAVVDPLIPCFQVSELASLNNNTYRTLGSPFILNHERTLTLKLRPDGNDYPVIGMDNEALSIKQVEKAVVRLSDKQIKTVKLKNNSFWEKVQRTFL